MIACTQARCVAALRGGRRHQREVARGRADIQVLNPERQRHLTPPPLSRCPGKVCQPISLPTFLLPARQLGGRSQQSEVARGRAEGRATFGKEGQGETASPEPRT